MKASAGKIRTVAAAAVVAGGLVGVAGSGTASAAPASLTLNYTCPFPLIGTQPLVVKISTDIPSTIKVGEQTPEIVVDTVTSVPAAATEGLTLVGGKTLEGSALADSTIAAPGISLPVKVPAALEKRDIPASGGFDVKATGKAPALTFSTPGTAKVTVGNILLKLAPRTATGELTGLGEFEAPCTQVEGQNNLLTSFQITDGSGGGDTEPPTAPAAPSVTAKTATSVSLKWGASTDNVGVTGYDVYSGTGMVASVTGTSTEVTGLKPATEYSFTVKAKDAAGNSSPASAPVTATTEKGDEPPAGQGPPEGCGALEGPPEATAKACAFMSGFANAAKLKGATVLNDPTQNPVHTNVVIMPPKQEPPFLTSRNLFQFSAPMRSKATFLTFGFMPTTATMELTQVGVGTLEGRTRLDNFADFTVEGRAKMSVRVFDAKVNGTPMDLGPNCKTESLVEIVLTGGTPEYQSILNGGPLRGVVTYPPFTGCGVEEDLSPVITASVSGPGNHIKVIQGNVCMPNTTEPCRRPEPAR